MEVLHEAHAPGDPHQQVRATVAGRRRGGLGAALAGGQHPRGHVQAPDEVLDEAVLLDDGERRLGDHRLDRWRSASYKTLNLKVLCFLLPTLACLIRSIGWFGNGFLALRL